MTTAPATQSGQVLLQGLRDHSLFSAAAHCLGYVSEVSLKDTLGAAALIGMQSICSLTLANGLQILQSHPNSAARSTARG